MAKNILAVYEPCQVYLERFINYINSKTNLLFEVIGFTNLDILLSYQQENKISLLLFSQGGHTLISDSNDSYFSSLKILRAAIDVIILGDKQFTNLINVELFRDGNLKMKNIFPFQSMEFIIQELTSFFKEKSMKTYGNAYSEIDVMNEEFSVYGIYSPFDKCSHPEIALKILSNMKEQTGYKPKALYMCLEQFSGISSLLDVNKDTNISDLIYYYNTNTEKMVQEIERKKGSFGGMDVLSAPAEPDDLFEVKGDCWPDFLSKICSAGDYQILFLDINHIVDDVLSCIFQFGKLCVPALPNNMYLDGDEASELYLLDNCAEGTVINRRKAKLDEFKQYLKNTGREEYLNKVLEVQVNVN